ncbi:reverse transcriptase [Labeo rohita]|uniref:Reverse transcriptase n=1 Tax=Labeo rohita TaxID=84645 RepID=A0A498MJC6_LABRO|nr:reverse transcriptase [Labeo rohita]
MCLELLCSDQFSPIKTRVRQGCILSPFLALDFVMRQSIVGQGSSLPWGQMQQLADDIILLTSTQPGLASMTTALKWESVKIRLRISGSKTKIVHVRYARGKVLVTISHQ